LYGCKTWSFAFREEYALRVFENRVLGGYFDLRERKCLELEKTA
jgi:hypothetical protein